MSPGVTSGEALVIINLSVVDRSLNATISPIVGATSGGTVRWEIIFDIHEYHNRRSRIFNKEVIW